MEQNHLFEDSVAQDVFKKFETKYNEEFRDTNGQPSLDTQFNYAWCLVKSQYPSDVRKGVTMLEILFRNRDSTGKRDYLYYLAIGNAKLKEYTDARNYVRKLLEVEPGNLQAKELEHFINERLKRDSVAGLAVVGGTTLAFGALVALGVALVKRKS